ncbi:MAG: YceI family protein [Hyphomicrobium sp.]|uniref:YceI family protein n=1 Tax=Hyphomicrobium sp. TaxID=82 RepID=UPI0039E45082
MDISSERISRAVGAVVCVLATFAAVPAYADIYEFDKRRTEVRFSYLMGLAKQSGHFSEVKGTLQFDDGKLDRSKVSATVMTASLVTGEPYVDDELKGSDFFNVASNPVMTFKSHSVRSTGPNTADMDGNITVNGITKPITFQVSLHPHDDPALKYSAGLREFRATAQIQRSAFNMTAYPSMVGDAVGLEIVAVVRKTSKKAHQDVIAPETVTKGWEPTNTQ